MDRFACLYVPDLPLATALRNEPELRHRALAIVDGPTIVAGWLQGLTVAQAEAVRSDLVVRALSLEGIHSAQEALIDVAISVTPRVEESETGTIFLDLAGTGAIFPSERGLLGALEKRLAEVGLEGGRMGIGPTCTVAWLAARWQHGGQIVSSHGTRGFLDPLPLDLLDPPEETFDLLTRWGIRTLGELRRIPASSLGSRLGEPTVWLARRARGQDLRPFQPKSPKLRFEEGVQIGFPVGDLERLAFFLRGVVDRLTRRLRLRGLAVRELLLELLLESGQNFARTVKTGAPTTEAPVLVSLLRLALEKDPPPEGVERIRVVAVPGGVEPSQLDLFLPPLPAPAELAVAVARLEALCGPGKVGAPSVEDSHRPEAKGLNSFAAGPRVLPKSAAFSGPTMALRAVRPPEQIRAYGAEGPPVKIEFSDHRRFQVLQHAGPWRLFGEWWGESCFARDYFDVELGDGGVYRIYRNLDNGRWFLDGIYD